MGDLDFRHDSGLILTSAINVCTHRSAFTVAPVDHRVAALGARERATRLLGDNWLAMILVARDGIARAPRGHRIEAAHRVHAARCEFSLS